MMKGKNTDDTEAKMSHPARTSNPPGAKGTGWVVAAATTCRLACRLDLLLGALLVKGRLQGMLGASWLVDLPLGAAGEPLKAVRLFILIFCLSEYAASGGSLIADQLSKK